MTRNNADLLSGESNASSPYTYSFHIDNGGELRVLAHHPKDGVVGGLAWSPEGDVRGIYVHPNHRGGAVALGMLREATRGVAGTSYSGPRGSETVTQHGAILQQKLNPNLKNEYPNVEVHKTDKHGTGVALTDLSKYADMNYDVAYEGHYND